MAYTLNKVQLIGNLGRDPEVRYSQDGRAIANFSIATSESWKNAQGETQEKTEWHRVVVFGKLAEIAQQYLRKGSKVYVEGKISTNKWTDQSGQERQTTEIHITAFNGTFIMLDSKGGGGAGGGGEYRPPAPASQPASSGAPPRSAAPPAQPAQAQHPLDDFRNIPNFEDDIPF